MKYIINIYKVKRMIAVSYFHFLFTALASFFAIDSTFPWPQIACCVYSYIFKGRDCNCGARKQKKQSQAQQSNACVWIVSVRIEEPGCWEGLQYLRGRKQGILLLIPSLTLFLSFCRSVSDLIIFLLSGEFLFLNISCQADLLVTKSFNFCLWKYFSFTFEGFHWI